MSESRQRILQMLAEGKITVEEAERLLTAVDKSADGADHEGEPATDKRPPKFLYIKVNEGAEDDKKDRVNIKIPLRLIKMGMGLSSLLPAKTRGQVSEALSEKGIHLDFNNLNADSLNDLTTALREMNIEAEDGIDNVRIYCE